MDKENNEKDEKTENGVTVMKKNGALKSFNSLEEALADYAANMTTWQRVSSWIRSRIIGRVRHVGYWLRCHLWDRYHLVDCGYENPTGYRWGWNDVDTLMLYAAFELLRRFIENEDGLEELRYQHMAARETPDEWFSGAKDPAGEKQASIDERLHAYNEIKDLWQWWTKDRTLRHASIASDSGWNTDELYDQDTEMLCRLARVRGYLWT